MTLEELKAQLAQADQEEWPESVKPLNTEVLPNEEEDATEDDDYNQALYMLEDAAELLDELTDLIDHRVPVPLKMRQEMKKLSNKIVNYLINTDDETDETEDVADEVVED